MRLALRSPRRAPRSPSTALVSAALVASSSLACSSEPSSSGVAASASASASAAEAAPSPFSIVLRSAQPLVFSEVAGGVAAADAGKGHLARAGADGELTSEGMPAGLPEQTGSILKFAGRHPDSLWLTYEIPGEEGKGKDRKAALHPLLRLDAKKKQWKEYAADWRPLLGVWSKGRILAASTSSGKLKIKVMEPSSKKGPPDLPNPGVDDAECGKTLRIDAMAPLASGAVWMAGTCKPAGAAKRRHVAVFWAAFDEAASAAASASASAKPAVSAASAPSVTAATGSASAAESGAAPSGTASAGPAASGTAVADDVAGEVEEPKGPPGKVIALPAGVAHRGWAVLSERDVWILGDGEKGGTSHLHHVTGEKSEEVSLPEGAGAARAVAMGADGALWLAAEHHVFMRGAAGAWQSVPLPNGPLGAAGATWEIFTVAAVGKDVWVSSKATLSSGDSHLVLRLRAAKETITW